MVKRIKAQDFENQYKKGRRDFTGIKIIKRSLDEIKDEARIDKLLEFVSNHYKSRYNLGGVLSIKNLVDVDLSNSDLSNLQLYNTSLIGCNFKNSILVRTKMPKFYRCFRDKTTSEGIIQDCNFVNSRLSYVSLNRSKVSNSDFESTKLHMVKFPEDLDGFLNLEKANGLYKCFKKSKRKDLPELIQRKIMDEIIERI